MIKSSLASITILCLIFATFAFADDLILYEDFEAYEVGEDPAGWDTDNTVYMDVVDDPVKNGEKSFKVQCPDDEMDVWYEFGRVVTAVTIEFWIFPSSSSRTLSLLLLNASVERANAGPYMGWAPLTPGFIDRYASGGWGTTGVEFIDNDWTYVKVFADTARVPRSYDFYLAEGPDSIPEDPQGKNIPFRNTGVSAFDRVLFLGWSGTAGPAYLDNLLIYEGDERPAGIGGQAVEPMGKLATKWSTIKTRWTR